MKKRKLKKWVKILITFLIIIFSVIIYSQAIRLGKLVMINQLYLIRTILAWFWLLMGQFIVIYFVWE